MIDGYCTLGVDREYTLTEDALLRSMDDVGVARAVIGPVPRCMAVRNREGNELLLRAAEEHPDRFIPTCAASPWLGDESVEEFRRCLAAGARVLVFDPATQGFGFGDDLVHPLLEAAEEAGAPVYCHTGAYQFGAPAQLALAARRYPRVTFIMGHCGSTDFKLDAVEVVRAFPNVFAETSLTRPFGAAALVADLGPDKVIMGSAAPLNDFRYEWAETMKALPPAEHAAFYGGTLLKVLDGPV